jgi:L-threonylcarbamoyladenylate synthase
MERRESMRRVRVDPVRPDPESLRPAVAALRRGAVVACPTDTLYGLAVDPRDAAAVDALFAVKRRPAERAVPLVAADLEQVRRTFGGLSPLAERLAARFWPGPVSLVVPAPAAVVPAVHGGVGAVAVRVPAHAVARSLAALFGYPVTATSANRSGAAPAATADEVEAAIGTEVAVILDAGPTPGGLPSTIVDVRGDRPVLVREGAVPWSKVLESL